MRLLLSCTLLVSVFLALPLKSLGTSDTTCACGWTNKGRIVGGKEAKKNAYPFAAALLAHNKIQFCGGTIITPWHVVTAAHCTHDLNANITFVAVGNYVRGGPGEGNYAVARIIIHENYKHGAYINDISLLVTEKQMTFGQNVGPACLPTSRINLEGETIKALGWGYMKDGGARSNVLREVDLHVISYEDCDNTWKYDESGLRPSRETNVCTAEKNKDTCQGDSGGPLIWLDPDTNRYTLVALVSFGGACGGDQAAPNADVGAYVSWINAKVDDTKPGTKTCHKI